jgi:hypothetical protein
MDDGNALFGVVGPHLPPQLPYPSRHAPSLHLPAAVTLPDLVTGIPVNGGEESTSTGCNTRGTSVVSVPDGRNRSLVISTSVGRILEEFLIHHEL